MAMTRPLLRLVGWLADLRLAIVLLGLVAVASGLGTAIPQKESMAFYHQLYDTRPWLGLVKADGILGLELDHIYSSHWFLGLLAWLGLSLVLCSWRRQWPALQAALRWIDYRTPRQLSKLAIAETVPCTSPLERLERLEQDLRHRGWEIKRQDDRLAARRGVAGRIGPLLVHAGLVVLMVGAAWGALAGQRLERFLAPGRELELLNNRGESQLHLQLQDFSIQRDPAGRPEQFQSVLQLQDSGSATSEAFTISVNHPLRYRGMTVYQADWALATVTVQLGRSPELELPLQSFPQLGEQVWGLVLPTRPDGSQPVLLVLRQEQGPVDVYNGDGNLIGQIVPGGDGLEVMGLPLKVVRVLPASGLLLKKDPGVPLVYAGFAISLLGGGLSLVATRQLWAVAEADAGLIHVAGLCNRNLTAFAQELPQLVA